MKIIKPADLSGFIESDAPVDGFSVWEPEGRNFLTDLNMNAMAAQGSTGYFSRNSIDPLLYIVDLDTGAVEEFEVGVRCSAVSPSPDGLYFAVTTKPSSTFFRVTVYRVSDKASVYSFDATTQTRAHHDWSFDSGLFLHSQTPTSDFRDARLYSVDTTTWTVGQESATYPAIAEAVTGEAGLFPSFFDGQVIAGHKDANACSLIFRGAFTAAGQTSIWEHLLVRFDLSDMSYTARVLRSGDFSSPYYRLIHNPERSELILFFPNAPQAVSDSTLADAGLSPSLPAVDQASINEDGTEIVFRSTSVTPKFSRINTVDYTTESSLDPILEGEGRSVAYATDFYVLTLEGFGYALIRRLDDTLETENNPSVTKGDVYTYGDKNFRALMDNQDRPDQGALLETPTWLDLGAINQLRMIDGKVGSFTRAQDRLEININAPGILDGLALFGLSAAAIRVRRYDGETELYDSGEISLRDSSAITGWYTFFYLPRGVRREFVLTQLPPHIGSRLNIVLTSPGNEVRVGELVAGQVLRLGSLLFGSDYSGLDFSEKGRDRFGNFEIVPREQSKTANYLVEVRTNQIGWVHDVLDSISSEAIVAIGSEKQRESIIYGFHIDYRTTHDGVVYSKMKLEFEGLI